jgi:hypothetical protein
MGYASNKNLKNDFNFRTIVGTSWKNLKKTLKSVQDRVRKTSIEWKEVDVYDVVAV